MGEKVNSMGAKTKLNKRLEMALRASKNYGTTGVVRHVFTLLCPHSSSTESKNSEK